MVIQQIILLVINVVGGAAVIGSYALGLVANPGSGGALWGETSESIRLVYSISMIPAALGYFAFIYYILFRLSPLEVTIANSLGYSTFYWIFIGILVPSALWMPLTFAMIANPSAGMWFGVRSVLVLVGLSSFALLWALLSLNVKEPEIPYWLAVAGSSYFAFHTGILDMLLWPVLFRM